MNILYICPRFPYPPNEGDKVTVSNHLKFLSMRNRVTLFTTVRDAEELNGLSYISKYCAKIETFKRRPNFSIWNFIMAVFKQDPFSVIRYYSPKTLKRAKELIESGEFDVVHVAFYYMSQYAINKKIKVPQKTAVLLDTHNIEYLIYSRYSRLTKNLIKKLLAGLEAERIKKYELRLYRKFDKCIALSELDKKNIVRLTGAANIVVNPHCIELPSLQQSGRPEEEEEPGTLIYFGRLNTLANDDAIKFFYKEIFPLIKIEVPDVKFIIAGNCPSAYVRALAKDPSIRLLGAVPDIRATLKKISVVIVPLRLGGGIRMKILESWGVARPVVSTSIGAEGVDCKDREDIFIGDTPLDFKSKVVELLKNKRLRESLGKAGFSKVAKYYNAERIVENLENIYKKAIEEKGIR